LQAGRYQISGELGRGAMGVVYRAHDPVIGRTVAAKTIRLDSGGEDGRQQRHELLQREARLAGGLSHPGIVQIFDILELDGKLWIIMEFVNGPSLETLLASRKPLTREMFLRVISSTATALDYAHSRGVIHRDIKPGNLLLQETKHVKVADFGVAGFAATDTRPGFFGTPAYMAPELSSSGASPASDQYSLGVMAWEILTGERPSDETQLRASRINSTLTEGIDAVLARALAKNPESRFASCSEFSEALAKELARSIEWQCMPRGGVSDSSTQTATVALFGGDGVLRDPGAEQKRKRRWWLGAAAVLLLLVLAAGAWLLRPGAPGMDNATLSSVPPMNSDGTATNEKPNPAGDPVNPPPAALPPAAADPNVTPVESPGVPAPPPEKPPVPPAPGQFAFRVETEPAGATVYVDGATEARCDATPCELLLPEGRHNLSVQLKGFARESRYADIPRERVTRLELAKVSGRLLVRSTPAGATVFVNGEEQKARTPATLELLPGAYKIEVRLEGFAPWQDDVTVREGSFGTLNVEWEGKKLP
jgi:tRNA A-37 threonylcarbamoyl transferase component Bud32